MRTLDIIAMTAYLIIISSCQSHDQNHLSLWGNTSYIQDGVLSKYYEESINSDESSMDIFYTWLQISDQVVERYGLDVRMDTGFYYRYLLSGDQWAIADFSASWMSDESQVSVVQSSPYSWTDPGGRCDITVDDIDGSRIMISIIHTDVTDTIIDDIDGKVITKEQIITVDGDKVRHATIRDTYLAQIGLYASDTRHDDLQIVRELSEQLDAQAAESLRRDVAAVHRVGHIDDLQGLSLCYEREQINDYYNDDEAQYIGGKRSLWLMLDEGYNEHAYADQSGFLTYRFVINCQGEAGGYVIDETGYDYQPAAFDDGLKRYFLNKLKNVKVWKPLKIRGETRDAYTYITIKLRNGKIEEVLP